MVPNPAHPAQRDAEIPPLRDLPSFVVVPGLVVGHHDLSLFEVGLYAAVAQITSDGEHPLPFDDLWARVQRHASDIPLLADAMNHLCELGLLLGVNSHDE